MEDKQTGFQCAVKKVRGKEKAMARLWELQSSLSCKGNPRAAVV